MENGDSGAPSHARPRHRRCFSPGRPRAKSPPPAQRREVLLSTASISPGLNAEAADLYLLDLRGPQTPGSHQPATRARSPCDTSASRAQGRAGRPQSAPPSAQAVQITSGQTCSPPHTAHHVTPTGTGSSPPSSTYTRVFQIGEPIGGASAQRATGALIVAHTVVSVRARRH